MSLKPVVNVESSKLSHGFIEAVKFCRAVSLTSESELDLSRVNFVSPSFLLQFIVYVKQWRSHFEMVNAGTYLSLVAFPVGGVDAAGFSRNALFKSYMERYATKTYIPIVKFPTDMSGSDKRNAILESIDGILGRQVVFGDNVRQALKYIIGEAVDNIVEHAHSEVGYIVAQSYKYQGYTDICIADVGNTLKGSYQNNPRTAEILSDIEAIQAAVSGISAKNLPDAENRGYGFRTSINMLTKGLGGEYLLVSGDSAFAANKNLGQSLTIPYGIRFEGTIVAFRIPHRENKFYYLNYVE